MQCARCGNELEPGDNVCPKCAQSVDHETPGPPSTQPMDELRSYGAPQLSPPQAQFPAPSGTGYPGVSPYGQVAPPSWVSTLQEYVSTKGRGTALLIMLSVTMLFDAISILSDLAQISMLRQAASGVQISEQAALANDARQGLIALAVLGTLVVTVVVWCVWIHRADKNLPAFGARNLRFTPGWAVGWYFVPFMNLVRPYQVMQEICQASDPNTPVHSGTEWMSAPTPPLVGFWWGAYLINGFLGNVVLRSSMGAKSPEELISSTWTGIVSQTVSIVATILAIMMVRKVNTMQAEKYDALASQSQQYSPF